MWELYKSGLYKRITKGWRRSVAGSFPLQGDHSEAEEEQRVVRGQRHPRLQGLLRLPQDRSHPQGVIKKIGKSRLCRIQFSFRFSDKFVLFSEIFLLLSYNALLSLKISWKYHEYHDKKKLFREEIKVFQEGDKKCFREVMKTVSGRR